MRVPRLLARVAVGLAAFAACRSTEEAGDEPPIYAPDRNAGSRDGGPSDGAGGDALDAESDASIDGSGTPTSTPNRVTCGPKLCLQGEQCCVSSDGTAVATCMPSVTPCSSLTFRCDEAADCTNGGRCCFGLPSGGATCAAPDAAACQVMQLCRTDAECEGDETPCTRHDCNGLEVWLCGPQSNGLCTPSP